MPGLRWTYADDATLKAAWLGGVDTDQIAAQLGRTPKTVTWRAMHLGLRRPAAVLSEIRRKAAQAPRPRGATTGDGARL